MFCKVKDRDSSRAHSFAIIDQQNIGFRTGAAVIRGDEGFIGGSVARTDSAGSADYRHAYYRHDYKRSQRMM